MGSTLGDLHGGPITPYTQHREVIVAAVSGLAPQGSAFVSFRWPTGATLGDLHGGHITPCTQHRGVVVAAMTGLAPRGSVLVVSHGSNPW